MNPHIVKKEAQLPRKLMERAYPEKVAFEKNVLSKHSKGQCK